MMRRRLHVCTIISKNRLAPARVLMRSVGEHAPQARCSVLVTDAIDGRFDPDAEPFEVMTLADLDDPRVPELTARYDAAEFACALKPYLIRKLLEASELVLYLDSDERVYSPLDDLPGMLGERAIGLTPHLLAPLPDDGEQPDSRTLSLAGTFNAGFIAARRCRGAEAVLHWLCARLRTECRYAPDEGLVWDQRWLDLTPGLSEEIALLRDPGWNAGYWTLATTPLHSRDGSPSVDGHPLRCFHFSGFDPEQPQRLSSFDTRVDLAKDEYVAQLCAAYAQELRDSGYRECREWPFSYASLPNGLDYTSTLRRLWDEAHELGDLELPPFTAEGERAFMNWLAAPLVRGPYRRFSRYAAHLHRSRADLQSQFPDVANADREGFARWLATAGRSEAGSPLPLLPDPSSRPRRAGVRDLAPGEKLPLERDSVAVCIPVYGQPGLLAQCLRSVLEHTPTDVPILVADDASPDPDVGAFVHSLSAGGQLEHEVIYRRQPENLGFPENVNRVFDACAPGDVVLLNSDCVVSAGWLQSLHHAAHSDDMVATASALTNNGTILSVPYRNVPGPLPQQLDVDRASAALRQQGKPLYPRIPTAVAHCVYIRRRALDLVGKFDPAFSPGYGEEVDFSQRCVLNGLLHLAVDDAFVLHEGGGSLNANGVVNPAKESHDRIINARYPYYDRMETNASREPFGRLGRTLSRARRALVGDTVTIDGRCLGPIVTGTQVHTLEVIRALALTSDVSIRVIAPPDLSPGAHSVLSELPRISVIDHSEVHPAMAKTDLAHRPYQLFNANDLKFLRCASDRMVLTQQDLIAYRNPGYFPSYTQWHRYRRLTRRGLSLADRVVFFSHHAAHDALSEDLVEPERTRVVYIGVDHRPAELEPETPSGAESLEDRPFLLCLGTNFRHKNRLFALRLLHALREEHEWPGRLVLAGPRVSNGSSAGDEAAYLTAHPELEPEVLSFPALSETEKEWLLQHATAVVYPTIHEGFGLIPFEAASRGVPCLFAAHSALIETLGHDLATLVPWDASASAAATIDLLRDPERASRHVRAISRAGRRFRWEQTGRELAAVYREAADSTAPEAAVLARDMNEVELELAEAERKYNELWEGLTDDTRALIGPGGILTPEVQRSLLALANRPALQRAVLGSLRLAYRAAVSRKAIGERPTFPAPTTPPDTFELHWSPANEAHMREQLAGTEGAPPLPEP